MKNPKPCGVDLGLDLLREVAKDPGLGLYNDSEEIEGGEGHPLAEGVLLDRFSHGSHLRGGELCRGGAGTHLLLVLGYCVQGEAYRRGCKVSLVR